MSWSFFKRFSGDKCQVLLCWTTCKMAICKNPWPSVLQGHLRFKSLILSRTNVAHDMQKLKRNSRITLLRTRIRLLLPRSKNLACPHLPSEQDWFWWSAEARQNWITSHLTFTWCFSFCLSCCWWIIVPFSSCCGSVWQIHSNRRDMRVGRCLEDLENDGSAKPAGRFVDGKSMNVCNCEWKTNANKLAWVTRLLLK